MAITQTRMMELIKAGFDYKQGLDTLLHLILTQREHLESGRVTPAEVCNVLFPSARIEFLLNNPVQSAVTLISEEKHFRANAKQNQNKARKLRENRAHDRAGMPRPQRSSTAPPRIDQARGQRPNLLSSQFGTDPDMSGDLELGDFGMAEVIVPPGYQPGEISEKRKLEIVQEMEASQMDVTQFSCQHPGTESGQLCKLCFVRVE